MVLRIRPGPQRFGARFWAYVVLQTDRYPSTVDEQSVHLDLDYPDVPEQLNRWLLLANWLLAIPHYLVLLVLGIGAFFAVVAWFAILFTGRGGSQGVPLADQLHGSARGSPTVGAAPLHRPVAPAPAGPRPAPLHRGRGRSVAGSSARQLAR